MSEGMAADPRRAVRDGDVVKRPAGWWSPAVQALLAHLVEVGFPYAPRPLGIDGGCEMVSYIDGEHGPACWSRIATEDGLKSLGRLLRQYHDAVSSFVPPPAARWKLPSPPGQHRIICHGDFAPWNIVWDGPEPLGILDWEFAGPGDAMDDLAWLAIWTVPLRNDEEAVTGWDCWRQPPDRRRRLKLLVDAYGSGRPADLAPRAADVLRRTYDAVVYLAGLGVEPQRSWVEDGTAEIDLRRARWIEDNGAILV